jgi:hypothetical protein
MNKWDEKLKQIVEASKVNVQLNEKFDARCGKLITAAQAFIGAHAKGAGKLAKCMSEMMDSAEEAGKAVAELSVYEDDYEAAKKDKDKDKMKELDEKIKALAKSFEASQKKHNSAKDELIKTRDEIKGTIDALGAAAAG